MDVETKSAKNKIWIRIIGHYSSSHLVNVSHRSLLKMANSKQIPETHLAYSYSQKQAKERLQIPGKHKH